MMADDTEGTGWIVWSGGERVGAGATQAEAVEHARSRGINDGIAFADSGRVARLVRLPARSRPRGGGVGRRLSGG